MSPADRLLALVERGHQILAREREFLRRGELGPAARLSVEKQSLLAGLDEVIPQVRGTATMRSAVARLVEDGRRNEKLLLSARQGLALARRRLGAIRATLRGAVAYDRDGQQIASRDDAAERSSRA